MNDPDPWNRPRWWAKYAIDTRQTPADTSVCTECGHVWDLHVFTDAIKGCTVRLCRCPPWRHVFRIPSEPESAR